MLNLVINEASDYVSNSANAYNDSQLTLGTDWPPSAGQYSGTAEREKRTEHRVKSLYDGERFMTIDIKKETTKTENTFFNISMRSGVTFQYVELIERIKSFRKPS